MDNFSYVTRYSFYIKIRHIVVDQMSALFLPFANFLLSNKLYCFIRIMFTNKRFKPLCYLMACAREGFAVYVFVDNS